MPLDSTLAKLTTAQETALFICLLCNRLFPARDKLVSHRTDIHHIPVEDSLGSKLWQSNSSLSWGSVRWADDEALGVDESGEGVEEDVYAGMESVMPTPPLASTSKAVRVEAKPVFEVQEVPMEEMQIDVRSS